ncbi:MAG: hypothetical protein ACLQNE_35545 [Thermoguttaceae bacterium]
MRKELKEAWLRLCQRWDPNTDRIPLSAAYAILTDIADPKRVSLSSACREIKGHVRWGLAQILCDPRDGTKILLFKDPFAVTRPDRKRNKYRVTAGGDRQKSLLAEERPSVRVFSAGNVEPAQESGNVSAFKSGNVSAFEIRTQGEPGGETPRVRASSSSSSSKREGEEETQHAASALLPKILAWLGWDPSTLPEDELIDLLKLACLAITKLGEPWLEESCITARRRPTWKVGGNRIAKLKGIAKNKSVKLRGVFTEYMDTPLEMSAEDRLAARKACQPTPVASSAQAPPSASSPCDPLPEAKEPEITSLLQAHRAKIGQKIDPPPIPPAA